MKLSISTRVSRSRAAVAAASLSALVVLGAILVLAGSSAAATPTTVGLGIANSFAVLAGTGVSDVPTSSISGNVGLDPHPGSDITGLTCGEVNGTIYTNNAAGPLCRNVNGSVLTTAKHDLSNAYGDANGRTPTTTFLTGDDQLGGGQTLVAGVYRFGSATTANLTGPLTLSGSASAVWIFQATSDLVFASGSSVQMTGGASACNVFWVVNSSATLGTSSTISGTILALSSITANHGASITGRLLAENGLVSLDIQHGQRVRLRSTSSVVADAAAARARDLLCPERPDIRPGRRRGQAGPVRHAQSRTGLRQPGDGLRVVQLPEGRDHDGGGHDHDGGGHNHDDGRDTATPAGRTYAEEGVYTEGEGRRQGCDGRAHQARRSEARAEHERLHRLS